MRHTLFEFLRNRKDFLHFIRKRPILRLMTYEKYISRVRAARNKRALKLKALHDSGMRFAELGRRYKSTGERVRQLIRGLDEARK